MHAKRAVASSQNVAWSLQLERRLSTRARELQEAIRAGRRRRSSISWSRAPTAQSAPHSVLRPVRPKLSKTDLRDRGLTSVYRYEVVGYVIRYFIDRARSLLCHVESYKPLLKLHGAFLQHPLYRLRTLHCMQGDRVLHAAHATRIAGSVQESPRCWMMDLFNEKCFHRWRYEHDVLDCGLPQGGVCVLCNAPLGFGAENQSDCWRCGGQPERAALVKARQSIASQANRECGGAPAGVEPSRALDDLDVAPLPVGEDVGDDDDEDFDDEGISQLTARVRDAARRLPPPEARLRAEGDTQGHSESHLSRRTALTSHTCVGGHSEMAEAFAEALASGAYDRRSCLTQTGHPLLVTSYNRLDASLAWLLPKPSMDQFRSSVRMLLLRFIEVAPGEDVGEPTQHPFGCLARCLHDIQERLINHTQGAREPYTVVYLSLDGNPIVHSACAHDSVTRAQPLLLHVAKVHAPDDACCMGACTRPHKGLPADMRAHHNVDMFNVGFFARHGNRRPCYVTTGDGSSSLYPDQPTEWPRDLHEARKLGSLTLVKPEKWLHKRTDPSRALALTRVAVCVSRLDSAVAALTRPTMYAHSLQASRTHASSGMHAQAHTPARGGL